jgi:hypothetical protein
MKRSYRSGHSGFLHASSRLSALTGLLGIAAEGIATTAYYHATVTTPNPSRGQARTLAAITQLITAGHDLLVNQQYSEACDNFRQATQKALPLMA